MKKDFAIHYIVIFVVCICIFSVTFLFLHERQRCRKNLTSLPLSKNISFEMNEIDVINQLDTILEFTKDTNTTTNNIYSKDKILDYSAKIRFEFIKNKLHKVTYTIEADSKKEFEIVNSKLRDVIREKKGFENLSSPEYIRYAYGGLTNNVVVSVLWNAEQNAIAISFQYFK